VYIYLDARASHTAVRSEQALLCLKATTSEIIHSYVLKSPVELNSTVNKPTRNTVHTFIKPTLAFESNVFYF